MIKNCVACHRNFIATDDEPKRFADFCLDCLTVINVYLGIEKKAG